MNFHATGPVETAAEVAYGALQEVGRPDLADIVVWFEDDDGPYAEVTDHILDKPDWDLVDKAETLGRAALGLPSRLRWEP